MELEKLEQAKKIDEKLRKLKHVKEGMPRLVQEFEKLNAVIIHHWWFDRQDHPLLYSKVIEMLVQEINNVEPIIDHLEIELRKL